MAQWSTQIRLLKLMSAVQWIGIMDWESKTETLTNAQIPKFIQWLKTSLEYIPDGQVREALIKYYLKGASEKRETGFYTLRTSGQLVLMTLYNYQKEIVNG